MELESSVRWSYRQLTSFAFDEDPRRFLPKLNIRLSSVDMLKRLPWFNRKRPRPLDLETVLQEISEPFSKFPSDAVRWARKHREEVTPHLIRILEELPSFAAESEVDSNGHIIALCLLTEFGVKEALPAILEILNDESTAVTDCLADFMDGELAQILGRLADSPDQLRELIENPELESYIHAEAIGALVWMVTENHLDRESAIHWLHERFEKVRHTNDADRLADFAIALAELGAEKSLASFTDAVESGEIDPDMVDIDEVIESLSGGANSFENTLKTHRRFRIEHTVIELEGWEWDKSEDDEDESSDDGDDEDFGVNVSAIQAMMGSLDLGRSDGEIQSLLAKLKRMHETESGQRTAGPNEVDEYDDLRDSDIQVSTIRNEQRKVGRNDPCPCGSGKKYKKCCAQVEQSESTTF